MSDPTIIDGKANSRRRPKRRRPNRQALASPLTAGATVLPLKRIDVGETDANAEFFLSQRAKTRPMYLEAFYDWEGASNDSLSTGQKFILFGQKGTGKTAILRHLHANTDESYQSTFIVFRKEIIEEAQLAQIAATFSASAIVDEDKIKSTKFYYHAMKRLLLTFLLAKCNEITDIPEEIGWFKKLYHDVRGSSVGQIAALVTDSVVGSLEAIQVDVGKLSNGIVSVDSGKAIKRSNDAFQRFALEQISRRDLKARIFLDEMHFAYRDTDTLSADASLVRDTILAVREINEKLIEEGIDSLIYISIRSEFLEHQEISVADVAHTIESYGVELSWESAPHDRTHPMFDLILKRLRISLGSELSKQEMFARYIPDKSISGFLEYTWGKPRDVVRYFKTAAAAYPNAESIRAGKEFGNVIRRYSQAAWKDQKAALTAFVPKLSLPKVENALQIIASHDLDRSKRYKKAELKLSLKEAYDDMKANGVNYDIDEFIKLLYIVGIFYVTYRDASGQMIVHQFHRGNRHPYAAGEYHMHRAVARALS